MSGGIEIRAPTEQTEGTRSQILRWLKRVGESVNENEPLIEIETDKVTVEVASPGSGVLREILRQEQDEISPGELLGLLDPQAGAASEAGVGSGSAARSAPAAAGASHGAVDVAGAPGPHGAGRAATDASRQLSPAVRRLLAEHGLSVGSVRGTGDGGRLTVEDVLRAAGERGAGTAPSAAASPPRETAVAVDGVRRVPHSAVRRRIAEHKVQSLLHTAPHVTTVFEADMSAVLEDRSRRRDEFARRGAPLTLTAYFVQATVTAIRAVPEANSRWTDTALEIYEPIHVGIATAVEGAGLLVPVLRDAHRRDLFDTARGLDDLVSRARGGKLTPADMRDGTFTISNHGVSGSLLAAPIIINQPQSAILGIGKLERRAVVLGKGDAAGDGEQIVVRPRCYVTLTLDHRVMDGHQANRFMQTFVDTLSNWEP
jgi:2-oxoglutarate dehydrogenase E2 component (dihydrolipoamide succinyltransferase)